MHDSCKSFITSFAGLKTPQEHPDDDPCVEEDPTVVLRKKAFNLQKWDAMVIELFSFYTKYLRRIELHYNKDRHTKLAVKNIRRQYELVVFLSNTKKQMWTELMPKINAALLQ